MGARPLDSATARRSLAAVVVLALLVAPGAVLPWDGPGRLTSVDTVGLLVVLLATLLLPWSRVPGWTHLLPAGTTLLLVTTGHPTGGEAATALLVALPVVAWVAVHAGRRRALPTAALGALLVGATWVHATPPGSGPGPVVRDLAVFVVVVAIGARAMTTLATTHRARSVRTLGVAARAVHPTATDASTTRRALCLLAAQTSGAVAVALVEIRGDALVVTAHSDDDRAVGAAVGTGRHDHPAVRCHTTGRPVWHSAGPGAPGSGLLRGSGTRSVLWHPVRHGGEVRAVLAVGLHTPRRGPDLAAREAVRAAAVDVGWVLGVADRVAELESAATTDALTGAPNRRWLRAHAEQVLDRAAQRGDGACVLMLDLDRFKTYNDVHGHAAGDELLVRFAHGARGVLRPGQALARWGGEEFVVLLPGTGPLHATTVADRLRGVVPSGQTCSVGVAAWDGAEDLASVLARADAALYVAKARGRDRVVVAGARGLGSLSRAG